MRSGAPLTDAPDLESPGFSCIKLGSPNEGFLALNGSMGEPSRLPFFHTGPEGPTGRLGFFVWGAQKYGTIEKINE